MSCVHLMLHIWPGPARVFEKEARRPGAAFYRKMVQQEHTKEEQRIQVRILLRG